MVPSAPVAQLVNSLKRMTAGRLSEIGALRERRHADRRQHIAPSVAGSCHDFRYLAYVSSDDSGHEEPRQCPPVLEDTSPTLPVPFIGTVAQREASLPMLQVLRREDLHYLAAVNFNTYHRTYE